jgi:hypothetical protein
MNNTEPTVEQLKKSLDIIEVAGMYGELVKSGANFKYKDDNSIVISPSKQIFSDFNGNITGGSVYDLVKIKENLTDHETIKRLKELNGLDTYIINPAHQIQRKKEAEEKKVIDFDKLDYIGKKELKAVGVKKPCECLNKDNVLTHYIVFNEYKKLFETGTITADATAKINYLFKNLIGWNEFFKCPSIIIKDDNKRIVDIIAYRPVKPANFDNWTNPKYIYKNSHNRGSSFLYPFRREVETILSKQQSDKYLIVGEGIKNGLNALLYSAPFISLESTSNQLNKALLVYIESYQSMSFNIISMFDGDLAGAKAYLNFIKNYYPATFDNIETFIKLKENIVLADKSNQSIVLSNYIEFINSKDFKIKNFLKFDSNLDFVEYLQGGNDE